MDRRKYSNKIYESLVAPLLIGFRDTYRALEARGIDVARIFTDRSYEEELKAKEVNLDAVLEDIEVEFSEGD